MANPFTSATAGASYAPPDIQQQQLDIARARQMAQLLQDQSMQPMGDTQVINGWAIPKSSMEGFSKLAQAWASKSMNQDADAKQKGVNEAMIKGRQDTASKMAEALRTSQPSQVESLVPGQGMINVPGHQPDMEAAINAATTSLDPAYQQMGVQLMQKRLEQQALAKYGNTPHYDQSGNAYVVNDNGEAKMLPGLSQGVSADKQAELNQSQQHWNNLSPYQQSQLALENAKMDQAQQHWGSVSPYQQAQLANEGRKIGIEGQNAGNSAIRTQYDTGQAVGVPRGLMVPQGYSPSASAATSNQTIQNSAMTPKMAAEIAAENAKEQAKAKMALPAIVDSTTNAINNIDGLLKHPGLKWSVGATVPGMKYIPGSPAADFNARLDQLKGGAFMQAYQNLKGGGQITEVEGKKATDAIARMSTSQSEKEFRTAMDDFKTVMQQGVNRARMQAGQQGAAPAQGSQGGAKFLGFE